MGCTVLLSDTYERWGEVTESVMEGRIDVSDRSRSTHSNCLNHEHNSLHHMAPFARGLSRRNGRSPILGFGPFCTACASRPFLTGATSFNHGSELQATETSGRRSLPVECRHRGHEPCEGGLKRDTSPDSFWFRQRSSDDDQSTFCPRLRLSIPASHAPRTPWPIRLITSISGWPAQMCVKPLSGEWAGKN